jgi:hypothetical protein
MAKSTDKPTALVAMKQTRVPSGPFFVPTERRAWDSNPQVLADNGFQDRESVSRAIPARPSKSLHPTPKKDPSLVIPTRPSRGPQKEWQENGKSQSTRDVRLTEERPP